MNRCFEKEGRFISNRRITKNRFTASVHEQRRALTEDLSTAARLRSLLSGITVSAHTRSILKALSLALTLVFLVGLVGAMDRGTLSFALGLPISGILLASLAFCLRSGKDANEIESDEED